MGENLPGKTDMGSTLVSLGIFLRDDHPKMPRMKSTTLMSTSTAATIPTTMTMSKMGRRELDVTQRI